MKMVIKTIGVIILIYSVYHFYIHYTEDSVSSFSFGIFMLGFALAGFKDDIEFSLTSLLGWILVLIGVYLFFVGFDSRKHNVDSAYFAGAIISYLIGLSLLGFENADNDYSDT